MIAVDLITEQELDKRFDTLSSKLKDTLTSERSLSVVNQICEKNKITDEEKITIVHQLVGLVVLGLIHSYDLGAEINDALSLENPKFSRAIAEELNAKVFLPIKAELENNYHPINPAPAEKKSPLLKLTPVVVKAAAPAPKPITLSDIGWSKQPAAAPNISVSAAIPTPTAATARPLVAPTPTPKPAAEPAPMMLHEDTVFKSAEKNTSFTLSKPGGAAEMNMNRGAVVVPAPTRPAVLEFGGGTSAGTSAPKPPASASSSVRPMGFGPSLASMSTTSTGSRDVSRIVPTTSVPIPKPPTPPMPPRPPQASTTPQSGKSIVRDFL
jgi:hypothetical protein